LELERQTVLDSLKPKDPMKSTNSVSTDDKIISKTKKKSGRPKNPVATKEVILLIDKSTRMLHQNHKLKNHGKSDHTLVDLVPSKSKTDSQGFSWEVIKYAYERIKCFDCNKYLEPEGGWTFPKGDLYSYHLRSLVLTWRPQLGVSYIDCRNILASFTSLFDETFALPDVKTMRTWTKTASTQTLKAISDDIHQKIKQAQFLHVDETPVSLNGVCWFVWVIRSGNYYYYLLKPSKGLEDLKGVVLGCQPNAIVTDQAAVYTSTILRELLGKDLEVQKCIVHIYRNLGKTLRTIIAKLKKEEKKEEKQSKLDIDQVLTAYHQDMLSFIPQFVELFSIENHQDAEDGLDNLYKRLDPPMKGNFKSIWNIRQELFVYKDPKWQGKLEKTNNSAETAMRIFARLRKRIRTFRSEEGLQAELTLLSVYATVSSQKRNFTRFLLDCYNGSINEIEPS
jgi:molybdopterin converting factor small subunit